MNLIEQADADFCREAVELFGCDEARISKPMGKLFLILGWKRNTRDNLTAVWKDEHGNVRHFDYLHEECVASGSNYDELRKSMRHYKWLLGAEKELVE